MVTVAYKIGLEIWGPLPQKIGGPKYHNVVAISNIVATWVLIANISGLEQHIITMILQWPSASQMTGGHNNRGFFKSQFRTAQGATSMASAEREAITGVWGQCPQRGSRGQSPWCGVRGRSPPEAECLSAFACPKAAANLTNYVHVELQCKENIFLSLGISQLIKDF